MEWSIGESGVRYTAKLSDSEGTLSLDTLTRDGHEAPHSEIGITRDSQGAKTFGQSCPVNVFETIRAHLLAPDAGHRRTCLQGQM